jgi:hypothetical protein
MYREYRQNKKFFPSFSSPDRANRNKFAKNREQDHKPMPLHSINSREGADYATPVETRKPA